MVRKRKNKSAPAESHQLAAMRNMKCYANALCHLANRPDPNSVRPLLADIGQQLVRHSVDGWFRDEKKLDQVLRQHESFLLPRITSRAATPMQRTHRPAAIDRLDLSLQHQRSGDEIQSMLNAERARDGSLEHIAAEFVHAVASAFETLSAEYPDRLPPEVAARRMSLHPMPLLFTLDRPGLLGAAWVCELAAECIGRGLANNEDKWPTVSEAADIARVHKGKISRWASDNQEHRTNGRQGNRLRINPVELCDYAMERIKRSAQAERSSSSPTILIRVPRQAFRCLHCQSIYVNSHPTCPLCQKEGKEGCLAQIRDRN